MESFHCRCLCLSNHTAGVPLCSTGVICFPRRNLPVYPLGLFARVFYSIEKDIAKLADILGHSSINTTRIYIISTGTEHRQRMERMRLII